MPLYTYVCGDCEAAQERITSYSVRNEPVSCQCGGQMTRRGVETFSVGQPAYQMQGILADGTHVPGHFGKSAKWDRKKR